MLDTGKLRDSTGEVESCFINWIKNRFCLIILKVNGMKHQNEVVIHILREGQFSTE